MGLRDVHLRGAEKCRRRARFVREYTKIKEDRCQKKISVRIYFLSTSFTVNYRVYDIKSKNRNG